MVGKKSALGLALGVAALAGAKWLGRRRPKHAGGAELSPPLHAASGAAMVNEQEVDPAFTPVPVSPAPNAEERLPSVMVYQQPAEMPSSSATGDAMVWFALFNDGPQGMGRIGQPGEAPSPGLAKIALPENAGGGEVFNGGPLPESFFSESPDSENVGLESEAVLSEPTVDPAPEMRVSSESKPEEKPGQVASEIPMASIVASKAPAFVLPKKRAEGESPRAWSVPPTWSQFTLRPKVDAGGTSMHRSILPHEAMEKGHRNSPWPLVTAAALIVLAVVALAIFGSGLDGGLVSEWKQHWSHSPGGAAPDDGDVGLWSKDVAKVAVSPTAAR
jgi:hypothetical protein